MQLLLGLLITPLITTIMLLCVNYMLALATYKRKKSRESSSLESLLKELEDCGVEVHYVEDEDIVDKVLNKDKELKH